MKILIAMSGGVDSSVAALLLRKKGYDCMGCTMRLYNPPEGVEAESTCCSLDDVEDARGVCRVLGIPYHVFNFTDDFYDKIIKRFIESYEQGRTPNPCIDCNRYMKFQKLLDRAIVLGCDKIATGHYARVELQDGKYVLKKALDDTKDQSYVLYFLNQEQLAHILFPLGDLRKSDARQLAEEAGIGTARKPDSQDICFVPDGRYADTICAYTGKNYSSGDFKLPNGKIAGQHKGIIHYTIGQRRGLGIAGGEPLYVYDILPEKNEVWVGPQDYLFSRVFTVKRFNWISGEVPTEPLRCKVKVRYRQTEQAATVYPVDEETVRICFDESQRAVTPGQSAVLYDGDTVLGGGEIFRGAEILKKDG